MVRQASRRSKKYEEGVDPSRIKKILEKVKPGMVEKESKYFSQIVLVEEKVKRLCEALGVPSYEIAQYLIYGRQLYSKAEKFSQDTLQAEAQILANKWASRGLNGTLLINIAVLFGIVVTAPPGQMWAPYLHAPSHHGPGYDPLNLALIAGFLTDAQGPQFFLLDCSRGVEADFEPDIPEVHSLGSEALAWRRGVFQFRDLFYLARVRIGANLPADFPDLPNEVGAIIEFYTEGPIGTPSSKYFWYSAPVLTGEALYLEGMTALGLRTGFMYISAEAQSLLLGGWFIASPIGTLTPDNRFPPAYPRRGAVNIRIRQPGSGENDQYKLARKRYDETYEWRSLTASKIGINGPWRVSGGDLEADEDNPFLVNGELRYNTETEELEVD